ncbi:MAG: transporter substrate-binding domain-containing protein [Oscillospiraceae bacterium]|nr:transporter substrate-binding domain-containing protein [Oscillospiraceae bacterium]
MKRRFFVGLLAAALVLLSACGQASQTSQAPSSENPTETPEPVQTPEAAQPADRLAQIQEKGEIIIGTEGNWSPWTYHDENDQLTGYDIEVARLVAEKLGVTATFIEGEWDGLLAGLSGGRYDMMANGVEITPDRRETFEFSTPYAYNRTAVIVQKGNDSIHSLEDLAGKRTANTISSTYAQTAGQYGAEVIGVDDLNQTMELLLAGRIDATLNSDVTFYDYLRARPDAPLEIAVLTDDATQAAFPVPKGETALVQAIDEALAELREAGTLTELSVQFFGSDISQE